ncbi:MAG: hypothetical protein ACOX6V_01035 [Patescibacteria group bacterium]|jgi:hypothetical protein
MIIEAQEAFVKISQEEHQTTSHQETVTISRTQILFTHICEGRGTLEMLDDYLHLKLEEMRTEREQNGSKVSPYEPWMEEALSGNIQRKAEICLATANALEKELPKDDTYNEREGTLYTRRAIASWRELAAQCYKTVKQA